MGRKMLVTGASGFVGAGLVRKLLAHGNEVHCIVRPTSNVWRLEDILNRIQLHRADLHDPSLTELVSRVRPHAIFHLASYGAYPSQSDARAIYEGTLFAAEAVFRAAREAGVERVVNAGSSSEYGTKDHPMREDELIAPNSHYAIGKAAQTHLGQHYRSLGLSVTTLRLFSVYGPFEEPGRLMPTIIHRALNGKEISLTDPRVARDYIYLDDVIDACISAVDADNAKGEVINVGSGTQSTLQNVYDTVIAITKSTSTVRYGSYAGRSFDTYTWVADTTKMRTMLGISPRPLAEGIQTMVKWFPTYAHVYEARA